MLCKQFVSNNFFLLTIFSLIFYADNLFYQTRKIMVRLLRKCLQITFTATEICDRVKNAAEKKQNPLKEYHQRAKHNVRRDWDKSKAKKNTKTANKIKGEKSNQVAKASRSSLQRKAARVVKEEEKRRSKLNNKWWKFQITKQKIYCTEWSEWLQWWWERKHWYRVCSQCCIVEY